MSLHCVSSWTEQSWPVQPAEHWQLYSPACVVHSPCPEQLFTHPAGQRKNNNVRQMNLTQTLFIYIHNIIYFLAITYGWCSGGRSSPGCRCRYRCGIGRVRSSGRRRSAHRSARPSSLVRTRTPTHRSCRVRMIRRIELRWTQNKPSIILFILQLYGAFIF
jgi:hypothetical protein